MYEAEREPGVCVCVVCSNDVEFFVCTSSSFFGDSVDVYAGTFSFVSFSFLENKLLSHSSDYCMLGNIPVVYNTMAISM